MKELFLHHFHCQSENLITKQIPFNSSKKYFTISVIFAQDGIPEHLVPHKGNDDLKFAWENLFWACNRCNSIKNNSKYEGKIIDCCKIEPEKHLRSVYEPHEGQILVKARDTSETSTMTAQLITESFNLDNTGLRVSSASERMKDFRAEWNKFFRFLKEYRDKKTKLAFNKVKARLGRSTADSSE